MITKYKADLWNNTISKVEVDREDKDIVFIGTKAIWKHEDYWDYLDTFLEAKDFITNSISGKIFHSKQALKRLEKDLEKVKLLEDVE